jgi:toxin FitB
MIILDTNVFSALMQAVPDKPVVAWLDRQPRISIWTTAITLLEIRFGLQILPAGKRRGTLIQKFKTVLDMLERRVAPFDLQAAEQAGDLMASRYTQGLPRDLRDTMIAGIAVARNATLATRNTTHFNDLSIPVLNPWEG